MALAAFCLMLMISTAIGSFAAGWIAHENHDRRNP